MIGTYDFCGHYEWTFAWLARRGGEALVREYWDAAIHGDSQLHASALIREKGIEGMKEYWGHTLVEENAAYTTTATETLFRLDMHACPSKGFLLKNGLEQYHDYCDHCIGWIGPMLQEAGFTIDHQHNHCGQCWWEMRRREENVAPSEPGTTGGQSDVRLAPDWKREGSVIDTFLRANTPEEKIPER